MLTFSRETASKVSSNDLELLNGVANDGCNGQAALALPRQRIVLHLPEDMKSC